MATLSVESCDEDGLNATYNSTADGGDVFKNDGQTILHIKNSDAGSHTITVTAQKTSVDVDGMGSCTKANASVAVPASGDRFLGPFPREAFNNSSNQAAITYGGDSTGVTIALIKVVKA